MTDKQKITEILKAYTKKHNISASSVILEEYAEELLANEVFILPEDLRGTEDFSISAFIEAMQMYKDKDQYIKPPCKVGDTVYSLREVSCEDIDGVHTECEHYGFGTDDRVCTLEKPQKCPYRYRIFKSLVTEYNLLSFARQWGKTVFLTKEEAEAKLKELQSK